MLLLPYSARVPHPPLLGWHEVQRPSAAEQEEKDVRQRVRRSHVTPHQRTPAGVRRPLAQTSPSSARRRRGGLRPGPARPRGPLDRSRLGRDGLRQPGQRPRPGLQLQRAPLPRHLLPRGSPHELVVVHPAAARLPRRPLRARPLPGPAHVARPVPGGRADPGGRPLRHPVGDALLRLRGHAQLLGGHRRAHRRRLLRTGPRRPRRPGRPVGSGRGHGTDGADAPHGRGLGRTPPARAGGRHPPPAPPRRTRRRARGGVRGVGDRGVRPLRRPRPAAPRRLQHPGRPGLEHRRHRPDARPERTHPVPPLHRATAQPRHHPVVVRPARTGRARPGARRPGPP